MSTVEALKTKHCAPCEGEVPKLKHDDVQRLLKDMTGWKVTHDGERIRKDWTVKNFMAGIDFFGEIARIAEAEQHHPDLHLEGYRKVWVEIYTHAIAGLSENDFILAAKIDQIPVKLKTT